MKPFGFIYITTNLTNGMQYIGQTKYRERMDPNYFGSGKAIRRAIEKNGIDVFAREILFEAFTKNDLDWAERYFISEFDAVRSKNFYNIAPGGRASLGFTGKKHSIERNKALSEKMKGHPVSEKARKAAGENGRRYMLENVPSTAISVSLDGIVYPSVKHALAATGYSRGRINTYLKTGIHPKDQIDKRFRHSLSL